MAIDVITLQINHLGITTALIITFGAFEVQGGFCFDKGFGFFTKPDGRLFSDSSFSKTSTYPRSRATTSGCWQKFGLVVKVPLAKHSRCVSSRFQDFSNGHLLGFKPLGTRCK